MRTLRAVFAAAALVAAQGCFEPPVLEILLLDFAAEGGAVAALEIQLADPATFEGAGVRRRIADREGALLSGADPWLARFEALDSRSDALEWRRTERQLRSFSRSAELDDPAGFAPLLEGDAALWQFSRVGGLSVLELVPTQQSRAARRERDRTLRELAGWAERYAAAVAGARALDAYAVDHPARATDLWGAVFRGDSDRLRRLSVEERALAEELSNRLVEAAEALDLDPRAGTSLSERVREVFHPFTARMAVRTPCVASEVEGFLAVEERGYVVPELALWEAIERLEGRWLANDPLRALVDAARSGGEAEVDLEPFVSGSIASDEPVPDGGAVVEALIEQLKTPALYRLAWSCGESAAAAEPAL